LQNSAQTYIQLAENTAKQLTNSHKEWTAFLETAARLYKYPYHEQLMIFAQRPEATACADYDLWNKTMRRYIRRGSKGIALIDISGDKPQLRYVFDVSDTGGRDNSRRPHLWEYQSEHNNIVSSELARIFSVSSSGIDRQFEDISQKLADEYWQEHGRDLIGIVDGSFLEEYDELNIGAQFRNAAEVSITYSLMSRCGLKPEEYFEHEDFLSIFDFNTPETMGFLGTAVSSTSEEVLRQIEISIKNYERSFENEQSQLQNQRGLPDTRLDIAEGQDPTLGQIRQDEESLSQGASGGDVQQSASQREADAASVRDRSDSQQSIGADDTGTGGGTERDREPESQRAAEVGGADEQHQISSGGNDTGGANLQLTLFPSENEQIQHIDEAESLAVTAFSVSLADIDAELRRGTGTANGKLRVYAAFQSLDEQKERIRFLKNEYGHYGHSHTYLDGTAGHIMYTPGKGMECSRNGFAEETNITYAKIAKRLGELIADDTYLTADEKAQYAELEYSSAGIDDVSVLISSEAAPEPSAPAPESIAETPPRPPAQADIDRAIQIWNGDLKSKQTAIRHMKAYARSRNTADFLRNEYGSGLSDFPVTVDGVTHDVPWTKVQRSFLLLMESDRIYTQEEQDNLDDIDPIEIQESLEERGIVNGHVVDNELAKNDPFIHMVVADAEQIAQKDDQILEVSDEPKQIVSENPSAEIFHITDDSLGTGTASQKFTANMDAIRTLKTIEAEGRSATAGEQEFLSRYIGWGGLADCFKPEHMKNAELRNNLTDAEYEAARASTLNAHYTSPTVIKAMYETAYNMGFRTGNILEPACGVGNFFGLLPESMANSRLYGTELDSITGRIAKQLYPNADIQVAGFETTDRRDFYDLAIGNVPFGQYKVSDKPYDKLGFSIHNYFFAKALDQVRPGGMVAFITSRYTLDQKSPEVRKYIADRAELLGAIRLPNNAFKANAGTEVVSDIIFLQKRARPIISEPDWIHLGQSVDGFAVNSYFVEHPEMVMGKFTAETTQYGREECTVIPIEGADLADQLHEAISNITGQISESRHLDLGDGDTIDETLPADPDVKNYSYTVVDGEVYYRENSRMVKPDLNDTAMERIKGMVELRDCAQSLINQQLDGYILDTEIVRTQAELNRLYDSFTDKYGLISSRGNSLAFADDSSYFLLCSLEVLDEDGNLERKADMFHKRTIRQNQVVTSVDTASEALALSIAEKACVDLDYMSKLSGMSDEKMLDDLRGVVYLNIGSAGAQNRAYVTADDYLSGNIREKLRLAQAAAETMPSLSVNVEALKAAMPKDLEASEIDVRLGATWIDKSYIREFMYETFQTPGYQQGAIDINYADFTADWNVTGKSSVGWNDIAARTTFGTDRASAYRILEGTLNLRDIRLYDTIEDADGKERRVLNQKDTTLAQQKQQAIKDAFKDWIWKDPERRQALVKEYNEKFNSIRPREYDGKHITLSGINPEITLREHQLNAIAHVLYGGNTLLAHEVGAGKTFEMVAAAMESKRLGLCTKSLFAVPNHLTEQWASEFLRLYPSANILVATKKDFETRNRKKFCARIATGDYDAIIIGHSQFERIPISKERQENLLQEQIWEIEDGLQELKNSRAENFTIKQMERTKKSLQTRLNKLLDTDRKDDVITFEQLGVDRLFVDEAHSYKNCAKRCATSCA